MKRRQLTEEEREQRRETERELVKQSIEELRSSDGWQKWLRARSRFHRYSPANQFLIAIQNPEAVRVASFRRWRDELGYQVRKGEHAIKIWAPLAPSQKKIDAAKAAGEPAPRMRFVLVPVFGDNQVDPLPPPAEPLPIEPPHVELEGDELKPAWDCLVKLADLYGCDVGLEWTKPAGGYLDPTLWHIGIDRTASPNARVKTLVHELAHLLVRKDRQDDDPTLDYAEEELVAESVAYTVTGTLGIDSAEYSVPYLTGWSERADLEILEATAKLVHRLATIIEDAVPENLVAAA